MKIALLLTLFVFAGSAQEAPTALAVSNATTGPASELGRDLNSGAQLYFDHLATAPIQLHFKDDGYEPNRAIDNTVEFAESGLVLLFNYLGTPTTRAVFNYAKNKQLFLLTPYTGADFLRQQQADFVFNLRASYAQEAEYQARYYAETLGANRIGIVIQADDFGLAFEKYFIRALAKYDINPKFVSRFRRNTNDVVRSASQIKRVDLDAVVFIGTYQPMATLINQVHKVKPELVYSSVSFVSSEQLIKRIPKSTKLLVTEVVPNPNQCEYTECKSFLSLANQYGVHVNHGSFEGFLNAKWLSKALEQCPESPDASCIVNHLTNKPIHLLGSSRRLDKDARQLLDQLFITSQNLP